MFFLPFLLALVLSHLSHFGAGEVQATFTGQEHDGQTSLQYFGARYYDNTLGKFVSIDPILVKVDSISKILQDPQSLNTYAYSRNNPVVLVDSDGNFWHIVAGAAIGALITGGITYWQTGDLSQAAHAAVGGAISGALFAAVGPASLLGSVATGAVSAAAGNTVTRTMNGEDITMQTVGTDATAGAVGGALGYGFAKGLQSILPNTASTLSDDALVLRGGGLGNQTVEKINSAIGPSRTPGIIGFSVQCSNNCTNINQLGQLGKYLRNNSLAVTKAGAIRAIGGDVIKTPGIGEHATVVGLNGQQANPLFQNIFNNPNPFKFFR